MRELSLFTGAGGGLLGSYLLGWHTVCAVEIEDYPRRVLLERQRDGILDRFPIWDDITTFDGRPWKGRIDIISGGFPCQDISYAGKRKGIAGEKSGLWKEMRRVVREIMPRFVFVENSPGLLSAIRHNGKWEAPPGVTVVFKDLAEMGYNVRWCVLGADDASAPHKRKRIWILAHSMQYRRKHGKWAPGGINSKNKGMEKIKWWDNDPAELPDTDESGLQEEGAEQQTTGTTGNYSQANIPNTNEQGLQEFTCGQFKGIQREDESFPWSNTCGGIAEEKQRDWWPVEFRVGRVDHGIPHRVDRLKAIGNGQVPAVAALAFVILSEGIIT